MYIAKTQSNALAAALILLATAFLATAFIAATTLMARMLGTGIIGPPLHALQISHGRFFVRISGIEFGGAGVAATHRKPHWPLHISRTVFGWGGVTCMFAAVAFIPLADATAISFLNPVFAMMLAIPLLGGKVGRVRWPAALMALIGAFILLRPTPDSFQPAALLALISAVVMGLELIFIKKLAGRESPFQILLNNNTLGLFLSSVAVIAVWQMPTPAQWAILAGIGGCMAVAQTCFVNAIARTRAALPRRSAMQH